MIKDAIDSFACVHVPANTTLIVFNYSIYLIISSQLGVYFFMSFYHCFHQVCNAGITNSGLTFSRECIRVLHLQAMGFNALSWAG